MKPNKKTPELLAPAGSPEALRAAIEGGADAVYIGGTAFNARINAKNFTVNDIKEGASLAHAYGAKLYVAANTLIFDREREDFLRAAEQAYLCGADALIVADIGGARLIRERIPIELHASTQLSGHNVAAARLLCEAGFSRMVCAREMSESDMRFFTENSPIEAEVFVHGALCVCHSGQCLFSSVVGGRSGNRGECAQPCRLPYRTANGKSGYPLSLKDLSLARHIPTLIDIGVASLKIEGRMKSPEYVRDVTSIFRVLLDEGRGADSDEMMRLSEIFSRGGFTDGYFTGRLDRKMLGVRSESDKESSRELDAFLGITRKNKITLRAKILRGEPMSLTVDQGITVYGDIPEEARNAPIDEQTVRRSLLKWGNTPYEPSDISIELDEGLMVPISALNLLRRKAAEALAQSCALQRGEDDFKEASLTDRRGVRQSAQRSAVFYNARRIPEAAFEYFDIIYEPLFDYDGRTNGVMLPAVVWDSESEKVKEALCSAYDRGARHLLIGNLGHLELARESSMALHGDFRLNIANSESADEIEKLGFVDYILSPELTLAQMRDIGGGATVYGRLPLMITEKCAGKEISDCASCADGRAVLVDRRGARFPVLNDRAHRSLIFNSVPTYMADRVAELDRAGLCKRHFIFTVETKNEVEGIIDAYKKRKAPVGAVRRIK